MGDGYLNHCKECKRANAQRHRYENLDKVREYDRMRGTLPHRREANRARQSKYKKERAIWTRRYRENNPMKALAHRLVRQAIISGTIKVRPCEVCGHGVGVHAHHDDYAAPLVVVWLCPRHHADRHKQINERRRMEAA